MVNSQIEAPSRDIPQWTHEDVAAAIRGLTQFLHEKHLPLSGGSGEPPAPPADNTGDNRIGHMTWGMQVRESAYTADHSRLLGLMPVGAYRATFLRISSAARAINENRRMQRPLKETYATTLSDKRYALDEATDQHQETVRWAGRGMKLAGIGFVGLAVNAISPKIALAP